MNEKQEWNKAATGYSIPHIRKAEIRKPAFMQMLNEVRNKMVLDLGCGDGYYSRLIAEKGAQVVGVDFSETSIRLAKQAEQERPLGIQYFQGDISNLSFLENNSFDCAIADMVFITIPTQEAYRKSISEVFRVLKDDGLVLISKGHPTGFNRPATGKEKHYLLEYDKEPSYFDSLTPQHIKININSEFVEWTNYHRTLEDFLNPWFENGFCVIEIKEPKPTDDAVEKYPEHLSTMKILPHCIIFKLVKKL